MNDNNYKDVLQRYMNNTFNVKVTYKTDKIVDKNIFLSKVYKIDNDVEIFISEGTEKTIKMAEQTAAKNALIHYGVLN